MSTFHARLIELESEIIAKESAERGIAELTPECALLLEAVEQELAVRLADRTAHDWKGWLTFRRPDNQLIICRGRAFKESSLFGKHRAGLDVAYGLDTVTEYQRGFDVSPPQELDHLLVNFGRSGESLKVFLWYGENIAPYRLIFEGEMAADPQDDLKEAVLEACGWIVNKPKELTLPEYLQTLSEQ